MKKIVINGNRPLKGEVTISGAKNSVVALIPAAILADSPVTLDGVPDIQDVHSLIEILEIMGAKITFENNTLIIDPTEVVSVPMPKGKSIAYVRPIILWAHFLVDLGKALSAYLAVVT